MSFFGRSVTVRPLRDRATGQPPLQEARSASCRVSLMAHSYAAPFRRAAEPPVQVRACRMSQPVFRQFAAFQQRVDQNQARLRDRASRPPRHDSARRSATALRAAARRTSRRSRPSQWPPPWAPARATPRLPPAMRTDRYCAWRASAHEGGAFGDLCVVPERAVLLVQQHEFAGRCGACRATRIVQQHQGQQRHRFGFRQQFDSRRPSRIASPERSCRVSDAPELAA